MLQQRRTPDVAAKASDLPPSVHDTAARAVGEVERKVRIDCDTCAVRDVQCGDCVMSVLLGAPGVYEVDPGEQQALTVLADQGLVPRLRLVPLSVPFAEDPKAEDPKDMKTG